MNKYSGRCPSAGRRWPLPSCTAGRATALEGRFELNRFRRLTPEQVGFPGNLRPRCQGKLNWVGDELDISYPTRARPAARCDPRWALT